MDSFIGNIEEITVRNENYREVISTTSNLQLVIMTLLPGHEVGEEIHPHTTQFIRIEEGHGIGVCGNDEIILYPGMCMVVPPGTLHNVVNISRHSKLKFYTIYSPPEHEPNLIETN